MSSTIQHAAAMNRGAIVNAPCGIPFGYCEEYSACGVVECKPTQAYQRDIEPGEVKRCGDVPICAHQLNTRAHSARLTQLFCCTASCRNYCPPSSRSSHHVDCLRREERTDAKDQGFCPRPAELDECEGGSELDRVQRILLDVEDRDCFLYLHAALRNLLERRLSYCPLPHRSSINMTPGDSYCLHRSEQSRAKEAGLCLGQAELDECKGISEPNRVRLLLPVDLTATGLLETEHHRLLRCHTHLTIHQRSRLTSCTPLI